MGKMGKIHVARPLHVKTRKELVATIRPSQWKYLREDNGDVPTGAGASAMEEVAV
jgi:hypothetical protein